MGFQKLNKKGLEMKSSFYAVIVVSMVIIAVGVIVGGWSDKYGSGLNYDLGEYEDLETFSDEAQTQKQSVTPQDPDPGSSDFEGKLFRGGYGILGRIFQPFRSIFNMLESVETRFGLPSYVVEGTLSLIFFSFITMIIAIIFRLSRSNA